MDSVKWAFAGAHVQKPASWAVPNVLQRAYRPVRLAPGIAGYGVRLLRVQTAASARTAVVVRESVRQPVEWANAGV